MLVEAVGPSETSVNFCWTTQHHHEDLKTLMNTYRNPASFC